MQGTKSVIFAIALLALTVRGAEISTIRIPDDGIAPQAAVDSKGVLHLTYFKETADNCGDLFHVRSSDDGKTFSSPILVNSHKGSAISVRTARIALGKDDRLHVLWNGSKLAQPKGPKSPHMKESNPYNGTPLLYT